MKIVCVIPARYQSSRFPGKPLCDIHGKPMIWWVYGAAKRVDQIDEVYVATDDERIFTTCEGLAMKAIMTSSDHVTGTDRIAAVAEKVAADLYVNVQGDEPMLGPETISAAIRPFNAKKKTSFSVTNLMAPIRKTAEAIDADVPKVVVNEAGEAVFLSRLPIPYPKEARDITYMKQVCVYGFLPEALRAFKDLSRGPCERAEGIELLRFLEHGITVQMIEVESATMAVDTPSDLKNVRRLMREEGYGNS